MPNQPLWLYQGESETRLETNQTMPLKHRNKTGNNKIGNKTMPLKQDQKQRKLCHSNKTANRKTGNKTNCASQTRMETNKSMPLKQDRKQQDWK